MSMIRDMGSLIKWGTNWITAEPLYSDANPYGRTNGPFNVRIRPESLP